MSTINFNGLSVPTLSLENKLDSNDEVKLQHKINYTFKTNKEKNQGVAILKFSLCSENQKLSINVEIIGDFAIEGDFDAIQVHKDSFKELFPYLRAIVTNLTTNAFLPAIVIPTFDLNDKEITNIQQ